MAGNRKTALENLKKAHLKKRGPSAYTVADLIAEIKIWEKVVKDTMGKPFSFIQDILQRAHKSDVLAKAIFDRIVPIPKEPLVAIDNSKITNIVYERVPEQRQIKDIVKELNNTGVFELLRNARSTVSGS